MTNDEQQQQTQTVALTISEVGRQLRVSRGTVYALMKSGELPYAYVGRSRRIPRAALDDYLARHTDMSA